MNSIQLKIIHYTKTKEDLKLKKEESTDAQIKIRDVTVI